MDRVLLGTLIAGLAFLPWIAEVAYQIHLQAQFLETLPASVRAALPRHPRRPRLAFLGSTRFQVAVWRSFREDAPDDDAPLAVLKARMRASLRREIAWTLAGTGVFVALLRAGWRPWA
jgi:hypothetical protein